MNHNNISLDSWGKPFNNS